MGGGAATQSSRGCTPATEPTGSARITKGHRQLVASGQLNLRQRRWNQSSLQPDIADFGPDLEFCHWPGPAGSPRRDRDAQQSARIVQRKRRPTSKVDWTIIESVPKVVPPSRVHKKEQADS